jgi:predicted CoA-binding protein
MNVDSLNGKKAQHAKGPDIAEYQNPQVIRRTLLSSRTVAIVGLSPNSLRASYFVGYHLQRHGYPVVPVNPKEQEILGETCYPSLSAIPFPVDVVDVFRRPNAVPAIAEEAVKIGAKTLWLSSIHQRRGRRRPGGRADVVMDR